MMKERKMNPIGIFRALEARVTMLAVDESGMSTVEYAIGTIAAAAFAAILYTVVTGDSIVSALTNIIARALNTKA
jgi:O-acetylhomoserine/O-acetylserine sulfhydrylase-like pyridoxal-dependent enzyme